MTYKIPGFVFISDGIYTTSFKLLIIVITRLPFLHINIVSFFWWFSSLYNKL